MGIDARRTAALFAGLFLALSMVTIDHAEARRGGSFGSRGSRTFQQAPATRTAPAPVAPVERTMTPNPGPANMARQPGAVAQQRPGLNAGFLGSGLFRGLLLGGLFGMLLGTGFGGAAGMLGFLVQLLLVGGVIWLVMRLFRSGAAPNRPAYAGAGSGRAPMGYAGPETQSAAAARTGLNDMGSTASSPTRDLKLDQADLDTFERRLTQVQDAFGREDHAALRKYAMPEMVSFLSEELADNAKKGMRNEVSDVRLLQADIAESWREGADDFATAAMLYESRDALLDRASGVRVDGADTGVTQTTELWTFRRQPGSEWKLSAIQET